MENRNNNLGDQIRNIVEDAVDSMNFSQLNRDISSTVNSAVREVRDAFGMGPNKNKTYYDPNPFPRPEEKQTPPKQNQQTWRANNPYYRNQTNNQNTSYGQRTHQSGQTNNAYKTANNAYKTPNNAYKTTNNAYKTAQNQQMAQRGRAQLTPINPKPAGSVSGVVCSITGTTFSVLLGIAIFVLGIVGISLGLGVLGIVAAGLTPLFLGSFYLACRGNYLSNRVKRFRQYASILQGKNYCTIRELSENTGKNAKYVIKDLRKMIQLGMFPQGKLDEKGTCFMLTNEVYQQYLSAQESMRQRNIDEARKKQEEATKPKRDDQLEKAIQDGKNFIQQIKEANDALPGEEISRKLYRLEEIITKIFECVEQHPEQLPEIRKFMEYYLPTTLKLVNAFREFEAQPVQGENITNSKREILATLDTINSAFENLLDSLYEEAAMEVYSDISVLQTLFAQEGLTGKDFETGAAREK